MKPVALLFLFIVISGCLKKPGDVEFSGTATGIKNGVIIIKDEGDSTVHGENIKDGKFYFKREFNTPSYFKLKISIDGKERYIKPYLIYLEEGKYTLQTDTGKLDYYPKITSSSKIQNQLSAFYSLADKEEKAAHITESKLGEEIRAKGSQLPAEAFNKLLMRASTAYVKTSHYTVTALRQFVKENPDNDVSVRLLDELNYDIDPTDCYAIFKTLKPALRNSERGKYIGNQLKHMVSLLPGETAPDIIGKTPDGKTFDRKTLSKEFVLVDFWRSGTVISSSDHQKILMHIAKTPEFLKHVAVVSVSLDSNADTWAQAINDGHLSWIQVSDLKGDNSPNIPNWMINKYPTYYLLDKQWRIVKNNMILDIPE